MYNQVGIVPDTIFADYDSDQESIEEEKELDEDTTDYFKFQQNGLDELSLNNERIFPHCSHEGYAWNLIRLVLLKLIISKLEYFVELAGFDLRGF